MLQTVSLFDVFSALQGGKGDEEMASVHQSPHPSSRSFAATETRTLLSNQTADLKSLHQRLDKVEQASTLETQRVRNLESRLNQSNALVESSVRAVNQSLGARLTKAETADIHLLEMIQNLTVDKADVTAFGELEATVLKVNSTYHGNSLSYGEAIQALNRSCTAKVNNLTSRIQSVVENQTLALDALNASMEGSLNSSIDSLTEKVYRCLDWARFFRRAIYLQHVLFARLTRLLRVVHPSLEVSATQVKQGFSAVVPVVTCSL